MINHLINALNLPSIFVYTIKSLLVQRRFIRKHIDPIIKDVQKDHDSSLTSRDFKKIRRYYGYAVPAILGGSFCILRDKPLTQRERFALTYLGALTGLYDDFFDEMNTSENHIIELTTNPNENIAQNSHELLFIRFYKKALENSPDPKLVKERFLEVFEAQTLSKKQKNSNISQEEISYITFLKGGVSLLFYRSVLDKYADKNEENMLYALGKILQLENDIFDIYKDSRNNINTLATIARRINNLRETYNKLQKKTFILLSRTNFPQKNKLFFMRFICLITFRGLVCLDSLERNEKMSNNIFSVIDYSRKQLICDMEKIKNIIKLIKYFSNCDISLLR